MAASAQTEKENSRLLDTRWRLDPDANVLPIMDRPKPWRKVALAVVLLVFGTVLLSVGLDQYFKGADGGIPLLVIGSLAFIPGSYHTVIAFKAWRGYQGYSLDDIPDM